MIEKYSVRFKEAPWATSIKGRGVTVVGAGGIGSWLALFLTRAGVQSINIFDSDIVEPSNIGGQFFSVDSEGIPKVVALKTQLYEYSPTGYLNSFSSRITKDVIDRINLHAVTFSCVDNMETRKLLFEKAKETCDLFIDGRMSAETFEIFSVDMKNDESIEKYHETLFDDAELEDAPCSFKATSHAGAMIGAMMTGIYSNYLTNIYEGVVIREVPFHTEVNIPIMYFNIK